MKTVALEAFVFLFSWTDARRISFWHFRVNCEVVAEGMYLDSTAVSASVFKRGRIQAGFDSVNTPAALYRMTLVKTLTIVQGRAGAPSGIVNSSRCSTALQQCSQWLMCLCEIESRAPRRYWIRRYAALQRVSGLTCSRIHVTRPSTHPIAAPGA